jgi:hypothetical protein
MTTDEKNGNESVEVVVGSAGGDQLKVTVPPDWQQEVWKRTNNKCSGCGSTAKLRLKLIVPEEAGGQCSPENAYIVCRACEIATDATRPKMQHANNRPINFWVSRRLFERMNNGLCSDRGFKSKSALIRYLMGKYIHSEPQFDDLEQYQDAEGVDDAKVNAWVPKDTYETFKTMLDRRGMSVTDAVKALVMVYESEKDRDDRKDGEL